VTKFSILFFCIFLNTSYQNDSLEKEFSNYEKERILLNIPQYGYRYLDNFANIPPIGHLELFKKFYEQYDSIFKKVDRGNLSIDDKINLDHIQYIISLQLRRISLEVNFKQQKDTIPNKGLYALKDHKDWYRYYAKLYTSVEMDPDDIFKYGEAEVKNINAEINRIQKQMGYEYRDNDFYTYLKSEKFYLTKTNKIEKKFREKESVIRDNLHKFFENTTVPKFSITASQNKSQTASPGVYLNGQNRFVYNFWDGRLNVRTMAFLIIHEGIPGHHYQHSIELKNRIKKPAFTHNVSYSGNFEGWASYAENLGKELGLYQTPEEELSKWEWDLVRSVRVMLDVGIHYYGWSMEKAIEFWNENIKGQGDIAYREITRAIYWPGQSLAYKIGARKIEEFKTTLHITDSSIKRFHSVFLSFSAEPLEVIEKNIVEIYNSR
jgi:uncharacterized protein (DUF885 family)